MELHARVLEVYNAISTIKVITTDDKTRIMSAHILSYDDFMSEPEPFVRMMVLFAVPGAVFAALNLLKQIDNGGTVAEVLDQHEKKLIQRLDEHGSVSVDEFRALARGLSGKNGAEGMN